MRESPCAANAGGKLPAPGETVGHYIITDTLGRGGMGEVYAAEDTKLHRTVALKILPAVFAADPASRERVEREARAVAALNHPNIVTIYSVEEDAGRPFLTMERVDGEPLSELIARGGLALERILRIGIEVADAMAAAQQRGITHRDLKPANIMVAADGRAKVLDFGLAKVRDARMAEAGEQVTRMSRELRRRWRNSTNCVCRGTVTSIRPCSTLSGTRITRAAASIPTSRDARRWLHMAAWMCGLL
jgi:serine/threonine protein kinase